MSGPENESVASGDAAAIIERAIAAYNGEQAGVAAQVRKRTPLFVGAVLAAVVLLAFLFSLFSGDEGYLSTPHVVLYVGAVFALFLALDQARNPAKVLQQGLRDRVLPLTFSFLANPTYDHGATPRSLDALPRKVVGGFNRTTFGDVIAGTYEDTLIEVFEATFKNKSGKTESTVFKGLVLAFTLEHPFDGLLIAFRRSGDVVRWFRDLFSGDLQTIDFVNPAIGEAFEVRTDNPDAARRLVDGSLAKALAFLRDTWPDGLPRLALSGQHGYVLLPTTKDSFELPAIGTPLDYRAHVEPLAHELRSLAAIARLAAKIR